MGGEGLGAWMGGGGVGSLDGRGRDWELTTNNPASFMKLDELSNPTKRGSDTKHFLC